MTFADHFSGVAAEYARYRPTYPASLFAELARLQARRERAWDCATGNGQAAAALARHFAQVVASDASVEQLRNTLKLDRVDFVAARAEASCLGRGTIDLVTVAQGVHWFDLDAFYHEARRVVRPGGLVAVWTYCLDDEPPWPTQPDGQGPTLELVDATADNGLAENWAASLAAHGTPGAMNSVSTGTGIGGEGGAGGAKASGAHKSASESFQPEDRVHARDSRGRCRPSLGPRHDGEARPDRDGRQGRAGMARSKRGRSQWRWAARSVGDLLHSARCRGALCATEGPSIEVRKVAVVAYRVS